MAAHEGNARKGRRAKERFAHAALDAGAVHHQRAGAEEVGVGEYVIHRIARVEGDDDQIAGSERFIGEARVDGAEQFRLQKRRFAYVRAQHRVARGALDALGHGAADETQTDDGDVHASASPHTTLRTSRTAAATSSNASGVSDCAPSDLACGRVVVHLDHQPIRARGHRRQRHGAHQRGNAGRVAGIDHHGQVREAVQHRHRREVERVARGRLKGADAALAEDDVGVAAGHDVFGAHRAVPEWCWQGRASGGWAFSSCPVP